MRPNPPTLLYRRIVYLYWKNRKFQEFCHDSPLLKRRGIQFQYRLNSQRTPPAIGRNLAEFKHFYEYGLRHLDEPGFPAVRHHDNLDRLLRLSALIADDPLPRPEQLALSF